MNKIESESALDGAFERSANNPVILFKHSLTCPVSSAALREYEKFLEGHEGVDATLIEIQNHRPLSNAVAERTGIRHESPQALVLKSGEVAWHASHWSITVDSLKAALG
ncbi:MAG: bacillithiol system redox-active protein YtxJ [Acidobacteriota bacterium]